MKSIKIKKLKIKKLMKKRATTPKWVSLQF
jgi:hypothetical protein